jgi:hypothetical protein
VGPSRDDLVIGSEGKGSVVYQVRVPPAKGAAGPSATPTPKSAVSDTSQTKSNHNLRWILIGAALFAFIVTIVTFPPGRRERLDRMAENARLTGQAPPDPRGRRRTTV